MEIALLIIKILSVAAAGAILTDKIEFIQHFKEKIGMSMIRRLYHKNKYLDYPIWFIHHLINCPCISFWISLFVFKEIWIPFLVYFISSEIYKQMNRVF